MKFGGTSVKDAAALQKVVRIVHKEHTRNPLVVVSACAGATTTLLDIAKAAVRGNHDEAIAAIHGVQKRHLLISEQLLQHYHGAEFASELSRDCVNLETLAKSISLLREASRRTLDHIAAYGEQWSSLLLYYALLEAHLSPVLVDARNVLTTDEAFTAAKPLFPQTEHRAREIMLPYLLKGQIVITRGFVGSTQDGSTTTVGRGGSDYSASILGAALEAEEIQIWTDVDGILTADPSAILEAIPLSQISYHEAIELSHYGAKVLHPRTLFPAMNKNIRVRVLNSQRPDFPGTVITTPVSSTVSSSSVTNETYEVVKSIATKRAIRILSIMKNEDSYPGAILSHIVGLLTRHNIGVECIANSEVGISVIMHESENFDALLGDLKGAGVKVEGDKAILCVVGENIRRRADIVTQTLTTLDQADVSVRVICHGASEHSLTFIIDESSVGTAVQALHNEFFNSVTRTESRLAG